MYLQTLLRKLGFDTEGLQNTKKYADVSLGFNPHVLITTANGRKVNGLELIRTIQRPRGYPKIIALQSAEAPLKDEEIQGLGIDLILDSPTSAKKLIMGLAQIGDLDEDMLLDKYNKIRNSVTEGGDDDEALIISYDETGNEVAVQPKLFKLNEDRPIGVQFPLKKEPLVEDPSVETVEVHPTTTPLVTPEGAESRRKRNEEFLAKIEKPAPGHFDRERIRQFNKKIRSASQVPEIDEIERDRKAFVAALYNKKPRS